MGSDGDGGVLAPGQFAPPYKGEISPEFCTGVGCVR